MDIKKTMQNLDKNGIKPYFVKKKEDVVPLVKTLIVTLDETGVKALMQNGDYDFIDRSGLEGEQLRNAYIKTFGCDTFFTSSNAVTENGELYNVDGNSNRVACIVYGPRQVIMIVGATPCNKTGKCISLSKENPFMCDGCGGNTRICCNYVVSAKQRHKDRIKLIIVNENLGY